MFGSLVPHRGRYVAVVDVESGAVGCAIMQVVGDHATVLAHTRNGLTLEDRSREQAQALIGEEVARATEAVRQIFQRAHPGQAIAAVYVVVHAPWTSFEMLTSEGTYDHDTLIDEPLIAHLAQSALVREGIDRSKILEAAVMAVRLNGYLTRQPEGKRAHQIAVGSLVSSRDESVCAAVERAVRQAFPAATVEWRSSARVNAAAITALPDVRDAVIVEVGVYATRVLVVRDGMPLIETTLSHGLRSLLTRAHGARPAEETLSLFRMLARDACADDACAELQKNLALIEPELAKLFGDQIGAFASERRLPNALLLIAHPDVAGWLKDFFERIDFAPFTLTGLPFTVTVLQTEQFTHKLHGVGELDIALTLGSAHVVAA